MSENSLFEDKVLSVLDKLIRNQEIQGRNQNALVQAVADLTEELNRHKEIRSTSLLRNEVVEDGTLSSSSNDANLKMERQLVFSPKNDILGAPMSVEYNNKFQLMKKKWLDSTPEDVIDFMSDCEDCIEKLKINFYEMYKLRYFMRLFLCFFLFEMCSNCREAFKVSANVLSAEETATFDEFEKACKKKGKGVHHYSWFNFLKEFSFKCFNEYNPWDTGIEVFVPFYPCLFIKRS
jgi:hypothetical protein